MTGNLLKDAYNAMVEKKTRSQRKWVGLTDEEIKIAAEKSVRYSAFHHGVFFAEAKLKEKNK